MPKLFIVHGVGSFQERIVLEDVGRLASAYGVDSGDILTFNWDSRVNRVFGGQPLNIGVLSEISSATLDAANLGFVSGNVYAGIPQWCLAALNGYALVVQMCGILWLPLLTASIFSYAVRLTLLGTFAGFLGLTLLASLFSSERRGEVLRAGIRRIVFTVSWPLLYSVAVPLAATLLLAIFLLGLPVMGFFMNRLGTASISAVIFTAVMMFVAIGVLLLLHALQRIAEPILKILSDIVRYIGAPQYRARLQQELTNALQRRVASCDHLIILAHSLGSVITVDSLLSSPTLLENVARVELVTMGSPLKRMFYGGFPDLFASPELIWKSLASRLNHFRWINVYRPLDVIGTRVSTAEVSPIVELNTQEYLKNHTGYWSDARVAALIQQALATPKPTATVLAVQPIQNWCAELAKIGYPGRLGKIWRYRARPAEAVAVRLILFALGWFGRVLLRSIIQISHKPYSSWTDTAFLTAIYLTGLVLIPLPARQFWTRFLHPFLQTFYGTLNDDNPGGEVRFGEVNQPAIRLNWRRVFGGTTTVVLVLATAFLYVIWRDRVWQRDAGPMIVSPNVVSLAFSDDGRLGIASEGGVQFRIRGADGCYGTIVTNLNLEGVTGIDQNLEFAVVARESSAPLFRDCLTVVDLERHAPISDPYCALGSTAPGTGAVSSAGRFLALLVRDRGKESLLVRDLVRKADLPPIPVQLNKPAEVTFTQDNCAAASNGRQVIRYCNLDKATPTSSVAFTTPDYDIEAFAFGRNGTLAILNTLGDLVVYQQGVSVSRMRAETKSSQLNSLTFSPDERTLAMARDGEISFWRWQKYDYFRHLMRSKDENAMCGAP